MNKRYNFTVTFEKETRSVIVTCGDLTVSRTLGPSSGSPDIGPLVQELIGEWFRSHTFYTLSGF